MTLTEKEKKLIKYYKNLYKSYIAIFIFIFIFAVLQIYFIVVKYIPIYLEPFKAYKNIQDFIRTGLLRCAGSSFIWIALLLGVLIGNLYTYKKIRKFFDKIEKEIQ